MLPRTVALHAGMEATGSYWLGLALHLYQRGDRVFHVKFGYGQVTGVEGNKLNVSFEKAGDKKVIDSFVEKA